jgi:hypothetical protein
MTYQGKMAMGLLGLALTAMPMSGTLASGTIGGGNSVQNSARMGQSVYSRKIACRSCMFPGGLTSAETARAALMKIESGEIMLSTSERSAVTDYINRRFLGM